MSGIVRIAGSRGAQPIFKSVRVLIPLNKDRFQHMHFEPDADSGDLVPPAMLTRQTSEQIQKPESQEFGEDGVMRNRIPVALRVSAGTFVPPAVPSVPLLTQRATMHFVAALCGTSAALCLCFPFA